VLCLRATVLRIGAYSFFERDDNLAKFWLDPVRLQSRGGFSRHEIARIQIIVIEYQQHLLEAWYGYFNN